MYVGHGIGTDGFQLPVDAVCRLFLVNTKECHIGHAFEKRGQHGGCGHGEVNIGVGGGPATQHGCQDGGIAEGGKTDDQEVPHFL